MAALVMNGDEIANSKVAGFGSRKKRVDISPYSTQGGCFVKGRDHETSFIRTFVTQINFGGML